MFAGHIKVLGGPHVARGPDVAQACSNCCALGLSPIYFQSEKRIKPEHICLKNFFINETLIRNILWTRSHFMHSNSLINCIQ
jgi:hypothetical protein